MLKKLILSVLLANIFGICLAQIDYTQKDFDIFHECLSELQDRDTLPLNELVIETAKYFLDRPYVAATLENNEEEQLVVNLREFDCTTFVESSITLSLVIKQRENRSSYPFSLYTSSLERMRYRDGKIDGYVSRIHYTSEWVAQNTSLFRNITQDLGGKAIRKPLSFMTSNAHLYPKLKGNDKNIEELRAVEALISNSNSYIVLDKAKIEEAAQNIQSGDIIIFATKASGLDYSHIGFALWEDGILKLLHASSAEKKVIIDEKSLVEYCNSSKSCTGITVLRLKD